MPAAPRHRLFAGHDWSSAAAFLVCYVALDWASYLWPLVAGSNIVPWNPQVALAIALLAWWPRAGWLVFVAIVAADVVVRGRPLDRPAVWLAGAALALISVALTRALLAGRDPIDTIETRTGLWRFAIVVSIGTLAGAVCYVWILSWGRHIGVEALVTRMLNYWVGNMVGVLVTLPLLFTAASPRWRSAMREVLRSATWWLSVAASCAALWIAFGQGEEDSFKFFYLLMLPVVWCSVRFGMAGAVLSANLTQVGLIVASKLTERTELTVFELQGLMAGAAVTAFVVGVLVDERARAEAELRKGLRFSAAGQLAAGLAHELGQPLTAMTNFAQASRMLLDRMPEQREQLAASIDRMLAEALRAADVAHRLRDFFTSGALSMRVAEARPLLDAAIDARRLDAQHRGVQLRLEVPPALPRVWMDPVQVGIVLRNLLANGIESASGSGTGHEVTLEAHVDDGHLHIAVDDSGPGVAASQLATLFDAAQSSKGTGMGVGLSICRSIVEAHGGRLWALPGPGGHFIFTLPIDEAREQA